MQTPRSLPVVLAVLALSFFLSHSEGALAARRSDRIAFSTFRPSNWDVYRFTRAGQAPERLTDSPGLEYDAVVSPDGRWLVFTSEQRGTADLYALDMVSGGPPILLLDSDEFEDQAAFAPDGATIAFVSTNSGNADIYSLPFRPGQAASMSDAKNLTHDAGGDFRPAYSPDGTKLAFSSDRGEPVHASSPIERERSGDLYVLDLASGQLQRLTNGLGWDGSPAWSADGATLVYYSQRDLNLPIYSDERVIAMPVNQRARIWIMSGDGSNARVVTGTESLALSPRFGPDGRILYSARNAMGRWEIVSCAVDGSGRRVESDDANDYGGPVPLPGGGFVAYGSSALGAEPPGGLGRSEVEKFLTGGGPVLPSGAPFATSLAGRRVNLYPIRYHVAVAHPLRNELVHTAIGGPDLLVARIDGSDQRSVFRFDDGQNVFSGLDWSPDGRWIGFTRGAAGVGASGEAAAMEADVWKVRSDGTRSENLTPESPGFDGYPSFSGDGRSIVFRSGRGGRFDLYLMDADGAHVRPLTNDTANDLFPVFSPTGRAVAFLSNRDDPAGQIYDVYLMQLTANGQAGTVARVTSNEGQHGHPAFSYDGEWLLYASERGGINDEEPVVQSVVFAQQSYGEIYAYRIRDGLTTRLTHNKWEDAIPSWRRPVAR